ncbi:hypothetical protein [Motilimonas eburnea]|uniref:hypothetical protein n=1 Tax=Motilimonas eburnea TaxID=1737488 RepID=UPI001E63785F|nr:hypothetical protein [Motilimonas eburnea]MCE2571833.1 hypothetical protein [Motilimonas eburnea]
MKPVNIEGVEYRSIRSAAIAHKIPPIKVRKRLKAGWTIEQALELPGHPKSLYNAKLTRVGETVFSTFSAACRHFGVEPRIAKERVNKLGWSVEEALELVFRAGRPHRTPVVIFGQKYPSQNEAARVFGVNIHTYRNRIASGLTPQQALTGDYVKKRIPPNSIPFFFHDELYPTFAYLVEVQGDEDQKNNSYWQQDIARSMSSYRLLCGQTNYSIAQICKAFPSLERPKYRSDWPTFVSQLTSLKQYNPSWFFDFSEAFEGVLA